MADNNNPLVPPSGTTLMIDPDQNNVFVPQEKVQEMSKKGYIGATYMTDKDNNTVVVGRNRFGEALKNGYKVGPAFQQPKPEQPAPGFWDRKQGGYDPLNMAAQGAMAMGPTMADEGGKILKGMADLSIPGIAYNLAAHGKYTPWEAAKGQAQSTVDVAKQGAEQWKQGHQVQGAVSMAAAADPFAAGPVSQINELNKQGKTDEAYIRGITDALSMIPGVGAENLRNIGRSRLPGQLSAARETLAGLIDNRGGKIDSHAISANTLDALRNEASRQGITTKQFAGREGGQLAVKVSNDAVNAHETQLNTMSQPYLRDQVDMRPVARAYLDAIDENITNNFPEIKTYLEGEAAKFNRTGTLEEVNQLREHLNKELGTYYRKGTSQKIMSDVTLKAEEDAVQAARKLQYEHVGNRAGIDPAAIKDMMDREGHLIEVARSLEKEYNVASRDQGRAKTPLSLRENVVGVKGQPDLRATRSSWLKQMFGVKPMDAFNYRMRTIFDNLQPYQPFTFPPNPGSAPPIGPNRPQLPPGQYPMEASPLQAILDSLQQGQRRLPPGQYEMPPGIKGLLPEKTGQPDVTLHQPDLETKSHLVDAGRMSGRDTKTGKFKRGYTTSPREPIVEEPQAQTPGKIQNAEIKQTKNGPALQSNKPKNLSEAEYRAQLQDINNMIERLRQGQPPTEQKPPEQQMNIDRGDNRKSGAPVANDGGNPPGGGGGMMPVPPNMPPEMQAILANIKRPEINVPPEERPLGITKTPQQRAGDAAGVARTDPRVWLAPERIIREAGFETGVGGSSVYDKNRIVFWDKAHPNRPVSMDISEVTQGGVDAVKKKIAERLAQDEPAKAGDLKKKTLGAKPEGFSKGKPTGESGFAKMDIPSAISEGAKKLADVFFSRAQKTAEEKLPNKVASAAVIPTLRNAGVPVEQLKWLDLENFLKDKPTVSKAELLSYIKQNDIQVKEIPLGAPTPTDIKQLEELQQQRNVLHSKYLDMRGGTPEEAEALQGIQKIDSDIAAIKGKYKPAKYGEQYGSTSLVTRGGKNLRELLLHTPVAEKGEPNQLQESAAYQPQPVRENYKGGHYGEITPNVLAHVRFQDRFIPHPEGTSYGKVDESGPDLKGFNVLHNDEFQSDWIHAGKDAGFRDAESIAKEKEVEARIAQTDAAKKAHLQELAGFITKNGWNPKTDIFDVTKEYLDGLDKDADRWEKEFKASGYKVEQNGRNIKIFRPDGGLVEGIQDIPYNDRPTIRPLLEADSRLQTNYENIYDPVENARNIRWNLMGSDESSETTASANKALADKLEEYINKADRYDYTRQDDEQTLNKLRSQKVADAPLKNTWYEMAFKRMLRYAAEHGYDRMTWTTGEQQAERYNLTQYVRRVTYKPVDAEHTMLWVENSHGGMMQTDINEQVPGARWDDNEYATVVPNKELGNIFGRELAERITRGEGKLTPNETSHDLKLEDGEHWGHYIKRSDGKYYHRVSGNSTVEWVDKKGLADLHTKEDATNIMFQEKTGERMDIRAERWAKENKPLPDMITIGPTKEYPGRWSVYDEDGKKVGMGSGYKTQELARETYWLEALEKNPKLWEIEDTGHRHLTGLNLQTGAKFHRELYDTRIPSFAKQYGKKWKAQVGQMDIQTTKERPGGPVRDFVNNDIERYWTALSEKLHNADGSTEKYIPENELQELNVDFQKWHGRPEPDKFTHDELADVAKHGFTYFKNYIVDRLYGKMQEKKEPVHFIDITPDMKKDVLEKGQPIAKKNLPATVPPKIRSLIEGANA